MNTIDKKGKKGNGKAGEYTYGGTNREQKDKELIESMHKKEEFFKWTVEGKETRRESDERRRCRGERVEKDESVVSK